MPQAALNRWALRALAVLMSMAMIFAVPSPTPPPRTGGH